MKDKKKKLIKIIVAVVLVVAIAVGGVLIALKKVEDSKFEAVIMDVGTSTVTQTLSTQGTVESLNRGEFEILDGVLVKEVLVKLGDEVESGQLLATFDITSLNGILAEKQSDYDTAETNYKNYINSVNDASAKLTEVEEQIINLEKEIQTLTVAAEKAKEEAAANVQNLTELQSQLQSQLQTQIKSQQPQEQPTEQYVEQPAEQPQEQVEDKKIIDKVKDHIQDKIEDKVEDKIEEEIQGKIEEQINSGEIPEWLADIDFEKLVNTLGDSYTTEELYNYFANLAINGADRNTITDIINSLSTGSSIDISSIVTASSAEAELMSAQMSLMTLKAQKSMLETQSQNILGDTYKSVMDAAKVSLDNTKLSIDSLANGWYAESAGIVSELNIKAGETYVNVGSSKSDIDMSSLMGTLSGGGNVDVNSIVSSLIPTMNAKSVGIAVEYYDSFIASFSLGKYDVLDVKVGQTAKITSLGHEFEGEVIYISPVASGNSGFDIGSMIGSMGGTASTGSNSIPAQVLIKNPDESIIVGIDVDIEIELDVVENAVTVPIEAVETDNTGTYVYKLNTDGETVTRVAVELGLATDTHYEVVSGCAAGDKIVQNPTNTLKEIADEGKKVAVTFAPDAAV